jgi:hypothetical protein
VTRVVLLPGVLALLPEYASLEDPVADLRAACLDAIAWLGDDFGIHSSLQGVRIVRHLADVVGVEPDLTAERPGGLVVVGNGSATRGERAPGHLDERASSFDDELRAALLSGDLSGTDTDLAAELWADMGHLSRLVENLALADCRIDYDDDPFGVQYWVARWEGRWR